MLAEDDGEFAGAARLSSPVSAIAAVGDGLRRVATRLVAAAMALSDDLGMGMMMLVGIQASVSLTRYALVSHTHTQ